MEKRARARTRAHARARARVWYSSRKGEREKGWGGGRVSRKTHPPKLRLALSVFHLSVSISAHYSAIIRSQTYIPLVRTGRYNQEEFVELSSIYLLQ
jgi:hypothetical protein